MTIVNSSCKMAEAFNNFPGRSYLDARLMENCTDVRFIDTDWQFWHNDLDKIVFSIRKDDAHSLLGAGRVALSCSADEFDYEIDGDRVIIRMWWD